MSEDAEELDGGGDEGHVVSSGEVEDVLWGVGADDLILFLGEDCMVVPRPDIEAPDAAISSRGQVEDLVSWTVWRRCEQLLPKSDVLQE